MKTAHLVPTRPVVSMSELVELYTHTRRRARRIPTWRLRWKVRRSPSAIGWGPDGVIDLVRRKALENELATRRHL